MRDGVAIAPFNLDLAGVGNKPSALTLSGGHRQGGAISGSHRNHGDRAQADDSMPAMPGS